MDKLNMPTGPDNIPEVVPMEKPRPAAIWNQPLQRLLLSGWENRAALKSFLSLTGGSILYCLSALSIIYGISKIIGPPLAKSNALADIFPCVIVLNVYELALLAVLVLIVAWKSVTDDAISLVIIAGIFLIGTGMTLGVVAASGPSICLWTGLFCTVLGLAKLYIMRRFILFPLGVLSFIGIGLILAWNFLTPSLMAGPLVAKTATDEIRRNHWLIGWLVLLTGAIMILIESLKTNPLRNNRAPFLQTPSMVLIFSLVLLASTAYHQYGIAYMFAVDYSFGDFIPLIAVCSLLVLELFRCLGKNPQRTKIVVSSIPLLVTICAAANKSILTRPSLSLELLWYPPILLAIISMVFAGLSKYHRQKYLSYVAITYAIGVLLTIGYSPDKTHPLNWQMCGAGVVLVLLILGAIHKNISLCFAAVIALAFGLGLTDWFAAFEKRHFLTPLGAMAGVAGLGTVAICIAFGRKTPRVLTIFAALAIIGFLFDYLPVRLCWTDLGASAVVAAISFIFWLRPRDIIAATIIWIPTFPRIYLLARDMSSWGFVFLSFVLLFVGACVSIFIKGRKSKNQEPDSSSAQSRAAGAEP